MMDAILFTVRDGIRTDLGYDARTCEIMDSGQPPPRCGDVFLAVHPAGSRNDMIGALNEYLAFSVTLTMRVVVPLDRVIPRSHTNEARAVTCPGCMQSAEWKETMARIRERAGTPPEPAPDGDQTKG